MSYIYVNVRQDPWVGNGAVFVSPVNERAFNRYCREAAKRGKTVRWLLTEYGDAAYWRWYGRVPDKHLLDYRHGLEVRVKVDPAIFETE